MHIAISGTYSTGKSTTAEALSLLTGIPKTKAKTMREIVPEVFPGKMLEECSRRELSQLGLLRFRERLVNESRIAGTQYISDGSCLHEWVYGKGRLRYGIRPSQNPVLSQLKALIGFRLMARARDFLSVYGAAAQFHAKKEYDVFVHLPVEFPTVNDGHRPVSEEFRAYTDQLLVQTLQENGIRYFEARGSIEERLERIVAKLALKTVMPVADAVAQAKTTVALEMFEIEELKRRQRSAYLSGLPWWRRLLAARGAEA